MSILRICILIFLCLGCGSPRLIVKKLSIDKSSLASSFARTPDPLQKQPPKGEKLYIAYWIPFFKNPKEHHLAIHIIYRDLSEETVIRPLNYRTGTTEVPLIGSNYKTKKGFFSYKVDLQNKDGEVLNTWEQKMWVKVLK